MLPASPTFSLLVCDVDIYFFHSLLLRLLLSRGWLIVSFIFADPPLCPRHNSIGYKPDSRYSRVVDIEFDIGSETIDYEKLAETEKLKPMELALRKLEDNVKDILENMEHLQQREERMRNTNGAFTNENNALYITGLLDLGSSQPILRPRLPTFC